MSRWRDPRVLLAGALSLLAMGLHVRLLLHAGALWRDEVNTLNVASMPDLHGLWAALPFESFPVLYPLLVRLWCALVGDADLGIRVLGLATGVCLVASLWWLALRLGWRAPMITLLLLALNPDVLRWGDSIRAYGLGLVLLVLVFEAMWRLVDAPSRGRAVRAGLFALLLVQSLYYGALFLLGICAGGAGVCLLRHAPRRIGPIFAIGAIAGLSLLPYLGVVQASGVTSLQASPARLLSVFRDLVFAPHPAVGLVSIALGLLACGAGALSCLRPDRVGAERRDQAVYALVSAIVGCAAYFAFLVHIGLPTQIWYYLGVAALLAIALEAALEPYLATRWGELALPILAAGIVTASSGALLEASERAFTNVDRVAAALEREARPGDAIVVEPWYLGISFARYYDGPVPWTTLPPLSDHRTHRLDLMQAKTMQADAIAPVLERARQALAGGHRVWIARMFAALPPGVAPNRLPPASGDGGAFDRDRYAYAWSTQLDHLLATRADRVAAFRYDDRPPPSGFEAVWLQLAAGLR